MTEEEKIRLVIRQFMESILFHRDTDKAMETISDSILGIGMGEQGTVTNRAELAVILGKMNEAAAIPCQVTYPREEIRYHHPGFATATIFYDVVTETDGKRFTGSFIQTIAAKKEEGQWKLCLIQAVPLEMTEKTIVNYPLQLVDKTLIKLKAEMQKDAFELMNESFSGGIFGTYTTENYPLYFANDTFIHQMGYTRDEFDQLFADNVTKIIYGDDRDRILREVGAYVANGVEDYTLHFRINTKSGGFIWVIEHARKTINAEGIPVLLGVTSDVTEMMEMQERLRIKRETIQSSMRYASKIQRELLPGSASFEKVFSDYSTLWKPRDIVGGDMYWLKTFEEGTVLGVCDCTGHGTPGALLTMLVASTFDTVVGEANYRDPAQILLEVDQKMHGVLNANLDEEAENGVGITRIREGCDLVVLFFAKDGSVTICSTGIRVFVCDGRDVRQIRGQRMRIGEGRLIHKDEVKPIRIMPNPDDRFYIATDGLYDQIGGKMAHPFGYRIVKDLIVKHHQESQTVISEKIWEAFETHRGTHRRRDDVTLITFRL